MALVVETGTGLVNANSYISAADATLYIQTYTDGGAWSDDVTEQEKALLMAGQALDLNWGKRFTSFRVIGHQSMLWPRYSFYDADGQLVLNNSIPACLGKAQAELALMYMAGVDLFPNEPRTGQVSQERTKVDVVETHVWYSGSADFSLFKKVDLILRPILKSKTATRMVR